MQQSEKSMPRLGFGTYGRTGSAGVAAILAALEMGYRHIDTAQTYDTEAEVGMALRAAGLPRAETFVTTKVAQDNLAPGALVPSVERSLAALGLDHVDLVLIHWPARPGGPEPEDYLPDLLRAQAQGLTRHVGVSNFTIALLDRALAVLGAGNCLTNQVELNPWFQNRRLAAHCAQQGVLVTCYQPLAQGRLVSDPVLGRIAARHGATPGQVALAWELAQGHAAIPASGNVARIAENLAARDLRLSADEIAEIGTLERGQRSIAPAWGPAWD